MRKLFPAFFFSMILCTSMQAQHLFTKDGMDLGDKKIFLDACIKGAKNKMVQMRGIEIDVKKYCTCMGEKLIPNVHSDDLMKMVAEQNAEDFLMQNEHYKVFLACLEDNVNVHDTFEFRKSRNTTLVKKISILECVEEMKKDSTTRAAFTEPQMSYYCSCAIDKLYASNLKYKDLNQIEETDSEAFNELVLPCVTEAMAITKASEVPPLPSRVQGSLSFTRIDLVRNLNNTYKVKVNIGGVIRYFTFDTGASDMIIDEKLEKELLAKGALKKEDYLVDEETYILANEQEVKGRMVVLSNIRLGEYTIDNVTVGILKEGSLLLGKSILDLFSRWEIQKDKNLLILYK